MEKIISMWIIDKYEKSSKFRSDAQTGNISVNLRANKRYMDENGYKFRFSINEKAIEFEKQELIKIKWYEKDNIIERIIFNIENMDVFYKISNRIKQNIVMDNAFSELNRYCSKVKEQWILDYFAELKAYIKSRKKLPSIYNNIEKKNLLFKSLIGIDEMISNEQILLQRVFSKKYLKDSKIFENEIRGALISIIRKYYRNSDDMSDEEVLNEFGIEKTSSELFLKGDIKITLNNKIISLDNFVYGVGLNTQTLKNSEVSEINSNRIISVENKANFLYECEHARKDDLIIFSGGFYNRPQKYFLRKIRDAAVNNHKNIMFFHSGDFDLGGINIFKNIKNEIFPELDPYKMDVELYVKNLEYGENFPDSYREKLEKMSNDARYIEFNELICEIIKNGKKLEQESLLIPGIASR